MRPQGLVYYLCVLFPDRPEGCLVAHHGQLTLIEL